MSATGIAVQAEFVRRYDRSIFDPETRALYDASGFYNVGDWGEHPAATSPNRLGEAARRLVERHLRVDPLDIAETARLVLDVGCGLGSAAGMMARHYRSALVLGVNLSARQAAHAAATVPDAQFAVMDAARLAMAPQSVDRIHVIEAAFHFDTRFNFLCEAHRALRPGGKMILSDILFRRPILGVPAGNLWVNAADYTARCTLAGFVVESFEDLTHRTVQPFCQYIAAKGKQAHATALRRAIAAYCLVVLRRPC